MRSLKQVLDAETTLVELQGRLRRELDLQRQLQRALPTALAVHVRVVAIRLEELELVAASGAAAALIRQRVPDLLRKLALEGWQFTGIRVRVQARPAVEPSAKRHMEQLDDVAAGTLRQLASEVGAGALATALERLARHTRRARDSDRDQKPLERIKNQDAEQ